MKKIGCGLLISLVLSGSLKAVGSSTNVSVGAIIWVGAFVGLLLGISIIIGNKK